MFFLGGITYPLFNSAAVVVLLAILAAIYGSVLVGRANWLTRFDRTVRRSPGAQKALLVAGAVVVTCGGIEYFAQFLVRTDLVEIYSPMMTQLPAGTEDWRGAHITADDYREPDPVLWWRPIAGHPYNAQRMKGPVVSEAKPTGVFRILCYGDSNTDGPDEGSWPVRLQSVLQRSSGGVTYEVLNAGVAGYTSHQGLLRFRQQVARFQPDLILVSFGWNDLATALGTPDREFTPPPAALVAIERLLLHYRFYLVGKRYLFRDLDRSPRAHVGHRVPLDDYLRNMEGFRQTAREHGAAIVFLTRPHREPDAQLRQVDDNWRGQVPFYNDALRRFGETSGAPVIDVQSVFEERYPSHFIDECHFSEAGHQRMAELLADRLLALTVVSRSVDSRPTQALSSRQVTLTARELEHKSPRPLFFGRHHIVGARLLPVRDSAGHSDSPGLDRIGPV